MKKISSLVLAASIASALGTGTAMADTFTNGGFESGTLAGWTGGGGIWNTPGTPAPINPANYNGGPANNIIVGAGVDPITGLSTVYSGNYSARVNDSINNYSVSTLRQTVLNYTDNSIFFAWNAVLEASHELTNSDYFSLTLYDETDHKNIVERAYSSAGNLNPADPGSAVTWTQHGNWYTSGWVIESIDLVTLEAVGHDFTLTLLASDCPYGGHAGYVYLDGFGAVIPPTTVPEPATLAVFGLGLCGLGLARRRKNAAK